MEYFMYKNIEENEKNKTTEKYYNQCNQSQCNCCNGATIQPEPLSTPVLILFFIFYLYLGIYASRLSWYSNTKAGWSQGYKIFFSIIAFMFPITYITAHVTFKLDLLSKIKGSSKTF